MEKNIIFCCLIALAQGRVHQFKPKIVNGTDAKVGEIPFQVSLQQYSNHFCGGSVLNKNYVVTAAHCVEYTSPSAVKIVTGTISLKSPGQTRQAVKITVHEGYSPINSYINDIALIKVNQSFEFSELVQPVPLPDFQAKIETNSTAVVSGWGRFGGNNISLPDKLQKAQIWIADQEYCKKAVNEKGYNLHPTQICANDPSTRRGQCNGDSGGPLIVKGKLTGIVSWSIKDPYCASTNYPGVYTRVPEFVDWIIRNAV